MSKTPQIEGSFLTTDAGQSRGFGFLRFPTLQTAEEFMDRNHPMVYLYGDSNKSNGDASRVRIAFSRERKEATRTDDADWICPAVSSNFNCHIALLTVQCRINNFATRSRCFRCQAPKPGVLRVPVG